MGTLYRNGIPYVGSGGAGGVEVTQAEYDALPTSEKMNGSIYFITDGSVSYPTASQMRYDNTESGIPSTSVQGAIDELKIEIGDTDISTIGDGTLSGAVSELNAGLTSLFTVVVLIVGSTGSVGANTTKTFSNVDISSSIPSGYTPIFVVPRCTGDDQFCWVQCVLNDDKTLNVMVRNCSSAADSGQPTVYVVCKKDN